MPIRSAEIENIIRDVQNKSGVVVHYPKDCSLLSEILYKATSRSVSVTTLKRFWGIIESPFNPSKFTLDSLAVYVGFENWTDYTKRFEVTPNIKSVVASTNFSDDELQKKLWEKLKLKSQIITYFTINSIKTHIGNGYERILLRDFGKNRIERFLNSPKSATAFVAPDGYGKSSQLAKLAEYFFLGNDARYPNDIVWMIDIGMIDLYIRKNFDFENFLIGLMGYDAENSFRNVFERNPSLVKGRMVLIFNGNIDLSSESDKQLQLINYLFKLMVANQKNQWFKMVVACNQNFWILLSQKIKDRKHLQDTWFDVNFEGTYTDMINVPLLSEEEISQIAQQFETGHKLDDIFLSNPEISEIINIPYFLNLYIQYSSKENVLSDIELLTDYFFEKVIKGTQGERKYNIINFMLEQMKLGVDGNTILKSKIAAKIGDNAIAYFELISDGIIYEQQKNDNFLALDYIVRFSHEIIFEFLIANLWLRNNDFNLKLLETIFQFYQKNKTLQTRILKWIIKFAFKESNTGILKNIYDFIHQHFKVLSNEKRSMDILDLINVVGANLRRYESLRNELIPYYASTQNGRYYYFRAFWDMDYLNIHFGNYIDVFLKHTDNKEDRLIGLVTKFWKSFFSNDYKQMAEDYKSFDNIDILDYSHIYVNLYLNCQLLYYHFVEGKIPDNFIDKIFMYQTEIFNSEYEKIKIFNNLHVAVIDALNHCDRFADILKMIDLFENAVRKNENFYKTHFYRYLQIIKVRTYIRTNKIAEAKKVLNNPEIFQPDIYPINSKYFWTMRYLINKSEICIFQKKRSEAILLLQKLQSTAKALKYKYFETMANYLLQKI